MSVLIDALKKAEERKEKKEETTTSTLDEFSDLFPDEHDNDELVLVEISNNEKLKTSFSDSEQLSELSSLDNWHQEEQFEKNQNTNLPETVTASDASQTAGFSEIKEPFENSFSQRQNDETNSTSSKWEDDFLPEFQHEIQELESSNALETETITDKSTDWNQEFLFNEIQKEEKKSEQAVTPNPLEATTSQALKTDSSRYETKQSPDEFELPKTLQSNQHFDSKKENSYNPPLGTLKTDEALENKSPLGTLKTDVDLDDKWFAEATTSSAPRPEAAKRIFAANALPPISSSKRTLGLLGVLCLVAVCVGYLFSMPSSLESSSLKFKHPMPENVAQQTAMEPALEEEDNPPTSPIFTPSSKHNLSPATPTKSLELIEQKTQVASTEKVVDKENSPKNILAVSSVTLPNETKTVKSLSSAKSSESSTDKLTQVTKLKPKASRTQPTTKAKQTPANSPKPASQPKVLTETSPSPASIQTLHKIVTHTIKKELSIGYNAFQRGDDKTASQAYQKALQQDQNNRDAMLGLGALALRKGKTRLAQSYYQRVLQLYPQDTYAQVGLVNTLDNHTPKSESQLKLLLEQAPQSAYISFSLGNLYANQGQWHKAQQAYFEAYRNENKQADYAYNLAISLEHLNQPQVALVYYQKALQLAQHQVVNFNPNVAQKRVKTLFNHTRQSALANLPTEY
jgi:Tfp pilus assembly protein PilF